MKTSCDEPSQPVQNPIMSLNNLIKKKHTWRKQTKQHLLQPV